MPAELSGTWGFGKALGKIGPRASGYRHRLLARAATRAGRKMATVLFGKSVYKENHENETGTVARGGQRW